MNKWANIIGSVNKYTTARAPPRMKPTLLTLDRCMSLKESQQPGRTQKFKKHINIQYIFIFAYGGRVLRLYHTIIQSYLRHKYDQLFLADRRQIVVAFCVGAYCWLGGCVFRPFGLLEERASESRTHRTHNVGVSVGIYSNMNMYLPWAISLAPETRCGGTNKIAFCAKRAKYEFVYLARKERPLSVNDARSDERIDRNNISRHVANSVFERTSRRQWCHWRARANRLVWTLWSARYISFAHWCSWGARPVGQTITNNKIHLAFLFRVPRMVERHAIERGRERATSNNSAIALAGAPVNWIVNA